MNNDIRYRLDNKGILAFIIGTSIICLISKFGFGGRFLELEIQRNIVIEVIVAFVATLFGMCVGALTALIGAISASALCGFGLSYSNVIALAVVGILIGQFVDKYEIRENHFTGKIIVFWNLVHIMALVAAFAFVDPLIDYIIYNRDFYDKIRTGVSIIAFSAVVTGAGLSILFYVLGNLLVLKSSKKVL